MPPDKAVAALRLRHRAHKQAVRRPSTPGHGKRRGTAQHGTAQISLWPWLWHPHLPLALALAQSLEAIADDLLHDAGNVQAMVGIDGMDDDEIDDGE